MDLTRAVTYRGLSLNSVSFDAVTRDMAGIEITTVEYGSVQGHGYDEKRAMEDGFDASDVFLGKRLFSLAGNVYGRTRAEAFHKHMQLTDLLTPTDAYESWGHQHGFAPFDFYQPTLSTADFPSGLIHLMIPLRPMATPSARYESDRSGGQDNQALAIPWTAQLYARVPYLLNYDYTTRVLTGGSFETSMKNRGNRPATLEVRLVVPARFNGMESGFISIRIGGDQFRIWIESWGSPQTIMYDTHAKVLSVTRSGGTTLRMDLLRLIKGSWHPKVKAGTQSVGFHRASSKSLSSGSYMRFRDTFA